MASEKLTFDCQVSKGERIVFNYTCQHDTRAEAERHR